MRVVVLLAEKLADFRSYRLMPAKVLIQMFPERSSLGQRILFPLMVVESAGTFRNTAKLSIVKVQSIFRGNPDEAVSILENVTGVSLREFLFDWEG